MVGQLFRAARTNFKSLVNEIENHFLRVETAKKHFRLGLVTGTKNLERKWRTMQQNLSNCTIRLTDTEMKGHEEKTYYADSLMGYMMSKQDSRWNM